MSDYPPPPLSPLNLPSAALHIHNRGREEAHPDSEDAVRHERQRFARELEPVHRERDATLNEAHAAPSFGSLRPRNTSLRNDERETSRSELRRYASAHQADTMGEREERPNRFYDAVIKFWAMQISLTIDDGAHRDHLALERTFLGYLRTSLLLVMMGIIIAQVFHLQHSATSNAHFGFYRIGKPLSATFICMAIAVLLVGAIRFWRLQRALVRGKAMAGGWEVSLVVGLMACLLLGTFALVLGVDIEKTYFGA